MNHKFINLIPIFVLAGLVLLFYTERSNIQRNFFSPEYTPFAKIAYGTGYYINDRYILTNAHVIEGCSLLRVTTPDYARSEVELVAYDQQNDLAALKTTITPQSIATFTKNDNALKENDPAHVIGYPGNRYNYVQASVVHPSNQAPRVLRDGTTFNEQKVLVTDSVRKGNSGGPLLNQYGNVIGTIDAVLTLKEVGKGTTFGSAVHNDRVKTFLNQYDIPYYEADNETPLDNQTLESEANQFIVQIRCVQ